MPNAQVIQAAAVQASGALNQGLTATEKCFIIRRRKTNYIKKQRISITWLR